MKTDTYLVSKSQVEKILNMKDSVAAVENGFKLYAEGKTQMPCKVYVNFPKGDFRCMPAYIEDLNYGGVKIVNVHPGNKDIPSVMATLIRVEPETGFQSFIMDATAITAIRTGAAGGIAAKYLAKKDSEVAAYIGAGHQAVTQLSALMVTMPGIKKVIAYDLNEETAKNFCEEQKKLYPEVEFSTAASIKEAAENADIITTLTPVRNPIVMKDFVKPGTHINAIGADGEGKEELDPEILKDAKIVIDDWTQASHSGEINVPLAKGIITKDDIYGEIGNIVAGKITGREDDEEITIFDSTGLAIQDGALGDIVFKKAMADSELLGSLQKFDFMG